MRKILAVAALLFASAPFTPSPISATPAHPKGKAEIVRRHVNAYFAAMRKGDLVALGASLADDYTLIGRDGKFETKAQRMEWLKGNVQNLTTVTPGEIRVRVYGNAAVVTGVVAIKGEGDEADIRERFMQMWVRRGGTWRMVAGQITTVALTKTASLQARR